MRVHLGYCSLLTAAMLGAAVLPAMAEDCTLKIAASVDTVSGANGAMLVPMTMEGGNKLLLLDTGGVFSELTPQTVAELGLSPHHIGTMQYDVAGNAIKNVVDVENVSLGAISPSSMQFMVAARDFRDKDSKIAGRLAPNILGAYDVDLDFANNRLKLISQHHCPGQVVYWPHAAVAAIPMEVTNDNRVTFEMQLDGHRVRAMLDTGIEQTSISAQGAMRVLGAEADNRNANNMLRFKTLQVEGITVSNPSITLLSDRESAAMSYSPYITEGKVDLFLGMSTLQHLHVYVAYSEKMLYITAGGAEQPKRAAM